MSIDAICDNKRDFLYNQAKDWLLQQIRTNKLKTDARLPGERELASSLKISRNTARSALIQLEREGFIERIPSKGAFIKTKGETRQIRLALIFPEAGISTDYLYYSNWAMASEVQRGLLEESMEKNSMLTFQYLPIDEAEKNPEKCADMLAKEYDGVFFPSCQHIKLMKELQARNYPFISGGEEDSIPYLTYNRREACIEAISYLASRDAREIVVLKQEGTSGWEAKLQAIKDAYKINHLEFSQANILEIPEDKDRELTIEKLKEIFPASLSEFPDAFFCTYPEAAFNILKFVQEMNYRIPDDFMLMGYGNNVRLSPMASSLTHVELPHYEIGRAGCRALIDKIMYGKDISPVQELKAKLIIGKTTR